jgi:hypothetical protein
MDLEEPSERRATGPAVQPKYQGICGRLVLGHGEHVEQLVLARGIQEACVSTCHYEIMIKVNNSFF